MPTYTVHYWLDDGKGKRGQGTPGRCQTDHAVEKGSLIYTAQGRAIVRSCIPNRARYVMQGRPGTRL
jgi:hypothetical protein